MGFLALFGGTGGSLKALNSEEYLKIRQSCNFIFGKLSLFKPTFLHNISLIYYILQPNKANKCVDSGNNIYYHNIYLVNMKKSELIVHSHKVSI